MTNYFNRVTDTARKCVLDYIVSDAFVLSDFAEKNNLECELEKYMKYAYIDDLDSYEYIKELIKATPEEYSKYNVSKEQLKRIVDSINNETYFEVVEQITKEVVEFRNKILGAEKDNTIEDSDVKKSDLNNYADNEEKHESEESSNSEEVVAPATAEFEDSDINKNQNKGDVIEKKSVFGNLKVGRTKNKKKAFKLFAGLRKNTESNDKESQQQKEDSSQATVAYQPAVANNLYGNTGVTNPVVFSPTSDFRTVEERISDLCNRLMMETDINRINYIANQIINIVPDKDRFMKSLLSKLKGM